MPLIKLDDGGRGQRVGAQEIRGWERFKRQEMIGRGGRVGIT